MVLANLGSSFGIHQGVISRTTRPCVTDRESDSLSAFIKK